ncbi:hypothetical protein BH11MYX3_BH11MYX3_22610 [soil metagenome]
MKSVAPLVLALAACEGTTGTISLELTTAPGSTVLSQVNRLRLRLTDPPIDEETTKNADGSFDLSLSFDAGGEIGTLIVEGYDPTDALVATGSSPPFQIGPTNAHVVIYVAPPMSIAASPATLNPPRRGISGVALPYGALFAGGLDAANVPSDAIAIYNAYDHSLAGGAAMPIKRSGLALGASSTGAVYLIGGVGTEGPISTILRFDTTVQPAGAYTTLGDFPTFTSVGAAVPIGPDRFLLSGTPPGELVGGEAGPRTELAMLPPLGASVIPGDGILTALFVGETGLVRFRADRFDTLNGPGRIRAGLTALPSSGRFFVAGGGTATAPVRDVLVIDPASGLVETRTNMLATARFDPAVTATSRYLVVAGGTTDTGDLASVEIFDAETFAPVTVLSMAAPRVSPLAFPLPNGQILFAGGAPLSGLVELFTPTPPE